MLLTEVGTVRCGTNSLKTTGMQQRQRHSVASEIVIANKGMTVCEVIACEAASTLYGMSAWPE